MQHEEQTTRPSLGRHVMHMLFSWDIERLGPRTLVPLGITSTRPDGLDYSRVLEDSEVLTQSGA
jgi:hypothetical protein